MNLTEEDEKRVEAFMFDAIRLAEELADKTGLVAWKGCQRTAMQKGAEQTLIISTEPTDWGEVKPEGGYLLWLQHPPKSIDMRFHIGSERGGQSSAFGKVDHLMEDLQRILIKLGNLELSVLGSHLQELIRAKAHMPKSDRAISLRSGIYRVGGEVLYRCDIVSHTSREGRPYMSFFLNKNGKVAIWAPENLEVRDPTEPMDFIHQFTDTPDLSWINVALMSDSVLELR